MATVEPQIYYQVYVYNRMYIASIIDTNYCPHYYPGL